MADKETIEEMRSFLDDLDAKINRLYNRSDAFDEKQIEGEEERELLKDFARVCLRRASPLTDPQAGLRSN